MAEYKIAVVTEDGEKISSHFGMAPLYRVYTIVDEAVTAEEERPKPHHTQHPQHDAHGGHEHAHNHDDMFAPIQDCQVLVAGGMGQPAFQKAQAVGLTVVMTGGKLLETVQAYASGKLTSDARRIH